MLTSSNAATIAVQRETQTIPIVFANVGDPVASGIVARLDRPGGNATGFVTYEGNKEESIDVPCSPVRPTR